MYAGAKIILAFLVIFAFVSLSFGEGPISSSGSGSSAQVPPQDSGSTTTPVPDASSATPQLSDTATQPVPQEQVPTPVSSPGADTPLNPELQPAVQAPQPAPEQTNSEKAPCPAIEPKQCEFGSKQDTNGCPTSECNQGPVPPSVSPPPPPQPSAPLSPKPPTSMPQGQLPENCKRMMMEGGIEKVSCETSCPLPPSQPEIEKCKAGQGIPQFFADSRGCNIFECRYQSQNTGNFGAGQQCPSEEKRSRVSEKCKSSGMRSIMRNDFNGCLIVDCVREDNMGNARCPPNEVDARIAEQCKKNGGTVVPGFDPNGCRISMCEYQGNIPGAIEGGPDSSRYIKNNECKEIPKEAFEKCSMDGGELVVKRDNRGCTAFADCIMRGNERNLQYEEVSEVPDASVLLSMAFKLENLKIEFDKLSKKTDELAAYYESTGKTADAERFRKASSMFVGAETRIDEIKSKMKSRVDSITTGDISEIKHDIKYIREVVMKDILYVMLGGEESGERRKESAGSLSAEKGRTGSAKPSKNSDGEIDCGTDGFCFNEQLRICEKAIFYPPSEAGGKTVMHIAGLDNAKCVLNAEVLDERTGASIADMTCKFPDYVMGMKGPEELMPYCEGSMAEGFKRLGAASKPGMGNKNAQVPPQTANGNYQQARSFAESPDGTAPAENTQYRRPIQPMQQDQPMQPAEPIIIRQTGQEFPQEIAPIGYLLKQFAII